MRIKITPAGEIFWLGEHQIPFNFAMRVRVQGAITVAQLQTALRQLCLRHPLIRSRLMIDASGQPWLVSDGVPDLPVRTLLSHGAQDWEAEILAELGTPFVPSEGPFVRLVLLQGSGYTDLVLVFSHNCVDGMAGSFITQDLLKLLGDPEIMLTALPPFEQDLNDLVPDQARNHIWMRLQCWGVARFMPLAAAFLKFSPRPNLGDGGLPPHKRFQLLAWGLDAAQSADLIARCHVEHTSVHAAVSAAFLRADAELEHTAGQKRWLRRVSSPVNLRACLNRPVGETAGLFMSALTTSVNCHPDQPFWQVAREMKQRLNRDLAGDGKFSFVMRTHAALTGLNRHDRAGMLGLLSGRTPDYDLGVTNLGRLAIPRQSGSLRIEAIHGPLVNGFPLERTVSLLSFDGALHFAFIFRDFVLTPAKAARIKTRAMQILSEAVG